MMTKGVSISVVIPTLGRPSLFHTLESLRMQLEEKDDVIVVADGPSETARGLAESFGPQVRYAETKETRNWGHAQRNHGVWMAKGDIIAFLDDDDLSTPWALAAMRKAERTKSSPDPQAFLFRMWYLQHRLIWRESEIKVGNVSSQMIVVPNLKKLLPGWRINPETERGNGGDFLFIKDVAERMEIIYHKEIVAKLNQHRQGGET